METKSMTQESKASWAAALGLLCLAAPARAEDGFRCSDSANAVAVDAHNRILVGGTAYDNRVLEWESGHAHFGDFAVSRLLPDGTPDLRFGRGGSVIFDLQDFDDVQDLSVSKAGVWVLGTTAQRAGTAKGPSDVVLAKLEASGAFDAGFGNDGVLRLDLGGDETAVAVMPAPFGGAYVAGTTRTELGADGFVLKVSQRGDLDARFGTDGVVRIDAGSAADQVLGARATLTGIVLGGQTEVDGQAAAFVAKLDLQGRPVARFGRDGMAVALVGGALGGGGVSTHTFLGSSAVSIARSADGTEQIATALFGWDGRSLAADGGARFALDVPSGTHDAPNAAAFAWGNELYLAGASYPDDYATGDAFLARVGFGWADGTRRAFLERGRIHSARPEIARQHTFSARVVRVIDTLVSDIARAEAVLRRVRRWVLARPVCASPERPAGGGDQRVPDVPKAWCNVHGASPHLRARI